MVEQEYRKRDTARKIWINDLNNSEYITQEGWNPNYITIDNEKFFRINIIGIVVSKQQEAGSGRISIIVEDNSGQILIRNFEDNQQASSVNVGEVIQVTGKPREFNGQKFIIPETIHRYDMGWMKLRNIELGEYKEKAKKTGNEVNNVENRSATRAEEKIDAQYIEDDSPAERIIDFIRKNDLGSGVEMTVVIDTSGTGNAEKVLETLLKQGDIFEIRPGRVKILE